MSFGNFPKSFLIFSHGNVNEESKHIFRFKAFRLDVGERQLLYHDKAIPLTPKAFDVLALLVERNGHLVEKDALLEKVWTDSFVEEGNIARIVHMLRKTLGEDDNGNKFIETVAKKGYRFVAKVTEVSEPNEQRAEKAEQNVVNFVKRETVEGSAIPQVEADISVNQPPAEPKQKTRIILFTFGFATAIALLVLLSFNFQYDSLGSPNRAKSIAVLPVQPINSANRDEIYENGIADALIQRIASIKGFVVRPLSSTRKYAEIEQDAIAAGKEQQVNYVLASNYQIADGKIKITSQFINVANGQIEETYKTEKDAANLFAMQDSIAAEFAALLQKRFVTTSNGMKTARGTTNEEAYRLYLQGSALAENGKKTDGGKAIEYLEQAVKIDPAFAPAYAELASVHIRGLNLGGRRSTDAYLKSKAAIDKALEIDETLAEAHSYLGLIKTNYEWDFAGAELEHRRALELNPNSSDAHAMYAGLLCITGRNDESIEEMKTAIDLEPASIINHHTYGWLLFQAHRFDEAIHEEERVVEIDPTIFMANNVLSNSFRLKGNDDKAFEYYLRLQTLAERTEPDEIVQLKAAYARAGWRGVNERLLDQAKIEEKNGEANYAHLAGISIELGYNDRALEYLEKAVDQNKFTLITLKVNPRYDPLRLDPRFDELVRRIGLK